VTRFPRDAPKRKVIKVLEALGFEIIREGNHISMNRINPDGSKTPLTMPNHEVIKGSTLLIILRQAGISREEFIEVFNEI
jgi:predicted RNA binding protein YcfA (HicA-like mRNA interferase family)